jgi:hypothetical protein
MKAKMRLTALLMAVTMVFSMSGFVIADELEADYNDYTVNEEVKEESLLADEIEEEDLADNTKAEETAVPIALERDGVRVILDGKTLEFEVASILGPTANRTLVPLRAIFEEMGAEIDWNSQTKAVTATKGDTIVVLIMGDTNPAINGKIGKLDQPAVIKDSRTLAPLRFVAEAFGGSVEWDDLTQTATITMLTKEVEEEPIEEVKEEDDEEEDNDEELEKEDEDEEEEDMEEEE